MTDIAVVGFAHAPHTASTDGTTNGVEMLVPCFQELYTTLGITKSDIGFWCSGSSDYLSGRAFSFIAAIDAIGAVPPINESHVEMDGAWALYEAWVKLMTGEVDTALVYAFGKSSAGRVDRVLGLQTDPYLVAPLGVSQSALAALQARLGLAAGRWSEQELAGVAARARRHALTNPVAQIAEEVTVEELLSRPVVADPLREHDCPPVTDGASAIVLAAGDRARELCERPAWITGIDHRIDSSHLTGRDWLAVPSLRQAADRALGDSRQVDAAFVHAQFTHHELLIRQELELDESVPVNPDGGPLTGNPLFSVGLERIGYAARQISAGADRVLAHASAGPLMQQNLVAVLEGGQ